MRTTSSATLARPAREQADLCLLNAESDAQRVYREASERVLPVLARRGLRWQWVRRRRTDNAYRAAFDTAADIVTLWNAGATESELRAFPNYFNSLIDRLSTGCAMRPLSELDLHEQELEGQENSLQTERLVSESMGVRVPADKLLREADVLEAEAYVGIEKSRALRKRARQIEGTALACFAFPIVADSTSLATRSREGQVAVIVVVLFFALCALWSALDDRFGRHRRI